MIEKDGKNIIISAAPDKVIFADLKNKQACKDYANCISGTFQYTGKVCSILIANGRVINNSSAHAWLGYPDSCLIYYKDGTFAVKRLLAIPNAELPQVQWAISGVGLLDLYNPAAEGYTRFSKNGKTYDYSDVSAAHESYSNWCEGWAGTWLVSGQYRPVMRSTLIVKSRACSMR